MSSTVPLMSLKSNAGGSDMVSEDDEDPLESLLTGMNFRAQKRRSRTFWSSLIFAGMICFTIGFAISYIAFVMVEKLSHPSLPISTDVDPAVVSTLLNLVTASSIGEHTRSTMHLIELGQKRYESKQVKEGTLRISTCNTRADEVIIL